MPFSTQIAAVLINLVVQLLPYIGVNLGTDDTTKLVQLLTAVATGAWIWYQRTYLKKVETQSQSDVTVAGVKK